jgi:RHS repeat-associated protein
VNEPGGARAKKIVNNTAESSLTETAYAGNYIYENDNLQFFNTAEGYIEPVISSSGEILSYDYIYQYKDHLGNIRLSYQDIDNDGVINASTEIREENNYYPFGLKHKGYNNTVSGGNSLAQAYKFGGKELSQELGLNTYDFGWRNYDPAIGRFIEFDPLAERREYLTPYNYVQNSPLGKIDSSGLSDYGVDKDGNVTLLKKSDDPDKVYSITHGEDNEITINDTNDDGNIDSSDSSGDISDRGLLASLSIGKKKGSKNLRYAFSQNSKDVSRLFKFFSDNTRVEWGLNKFKNTSKGSDKSEWFFLGTYQDDDLSPTPQSVISGFKNNTEQILNIHSHPGINFTDSDWGDGVLKSSHGDSYPGAAGDWVNIRRRNSNSKFYIYYPNWNGLYQYTPTNPQIKIMTVDDKDDLNKVVKSSNK